MSLLTQLSNKVQYNVSQAVSDPEADAYAKQQAQQAQQDAFAKQRADDAKAQEDKEAAAKAQAAVDAEKLQKRSTFDSSRATSDIASGILKTFFSLIFFAVVLYGGHLAANEAIGYNSPFRILSFVYGCLLFWYYIIKTLIQKFYYKMKIPYYGFIPLTTYKPNGMIEKIIYGLFTYNEDAEYFAAKSHVEELYRTAFEKTQIKPKH